MKRLAVSTRLARPWLRWSTPGGDIGCTAYRLGPRSNCASIGTPSSDRMQVVPTMLSQSSSKDHVYSASIGFAGGSQGHDLLPCGRRGLRIYASPRNALNLKPCVVIYDGVCHLCNAGVSWVIKVDKKKAISFCALQSRAAEPYLLLCGVTREEVLKRFVFIEGPDSCHQASTAALKVTSYLPLPYSALSIFMVIPAPIRDAVYDYVASRRYHWFGKSTECLLPTEDVLDRFVDKLEIQERMAQEQDDDDEEEHGEEKS